LPSPNPEWISADQFKFYLRVGIFLAAGLVLPSAAYAGQQPTQSGLTGQLRQAVVAAQHGDTRQAFAITRALLLEHPDFVPAIKLQGSLLEDSGHEAEAAASYEEAFKLAPNDSDLLLKVGIYRLLAGNRTQAIGLFLHRLKLVPHDGESLYYLSQAYHLEGEDALALKAIREAVTVEPANASVWQKYGELLCSSGNNEAAMRWLLKAKSSDPTLDRIDFDLGVASYNSMDFPKAVIYATKAANSRPKDLTILALLATAQVRLSHWQDAKAIFERILAAKPDDVPSLLGLGHCELELKSDQASVQALEHVLQLDPTQFLAHFYLARAFSGLGQTEQARHEADLHRKMMEQISFTLPKGEMQRDQAASEQARSLLTEHREQDALRLFQEKPAAPSAIRGGAYVEVGALYISMGNTDDALRCFNRALEIDPKTRGAYTYKGILALQHGDLSQAERDFDAELAVDPNHPLALAELGEVRYRQGRWSEAADQLARSKTSIPTLLFMLCDSYFRIGNISSANLTAELVAAYGRGDSGVMQGVIDLLNRNHQSELAERLSHDLNP
jgi:tetratricopeptide (TPR) repeat protein